MPTEMDKKTEDELVGCVAFAMIGSSELKKRKPTWRKEEDPRFQLARRIVAHLRLSNWLIKRGPPAAHHTTHPNKIEGGEGR
jgi:hypothetical protein